MRPGPWGPTVPGGRAHRLLLRGLGALGLIVLLAGASGFTVLQLLVQQAEANLTRVPVPELEEVDEVVEARHFLVVGSDSREGLDPRARRELSLGGFDGERSDVMLYATISQDREQVSIVSLPRDLLVVQDGRRRKLTDVFGNGRDALIRVLRESFGLPVNHFAEISVAGFVDVVETLDGVEICLEEPLRDWRSGADFAAGCQQMDGPDALAFVRSRAGSRADFERMDRQQIFLRAVLAELIDARVLANPRRLYQLVEDVASNLTTDDRLGTSEMLGLADELRGVVADGLPMTTVPAYPRTIDGGDYMAPYAPGASRLFEDLREGHPIASRGTRDERDATVVALHSGGRGQATEILRSTLAFAGFQPDLAGRGPERTDAGATTTVYVVPGEEERAGWVAALLGAPTERLPVGVEVPQGVHVLVAAGDDAVG